MKGRLLATISIALFVAGLVTLNLNSAVWAKDYYSSDSKNTFRHSEIINGKVNTKTNDNGNTQTNDNGYTQTNDNGNTQTNTQTNDDGKLQSSDHRSFNCDPEPECRKTFNNVMDMLGNLPKPTLPNLPNPTLP